MSTNNGNKIYKIIWIATFSAIALFIGYLFQCFNRLEDRVESYDIEINAYQADIMDIKTDLAGIRTDILWIKEALLKTTKTSINK